MSKKKNSTKPKDATSFRETKFGIIPRSKLVKLEAEGVKRGLKFIKSLSKKDFLISSELILNIHKKCFGWIFPKWAGKFRKKVPVLIKQFCDDLNERLKHIPPKMEADKYLKEVVYLTAWAQHRFVWIHPFKVFMELKVVN